MKNWLFLIALLFLLLSSCSEECIEDPPNPPVTPITKVSISGQTFVDASGQTIIPWGFNYTNPEEVGLIDDNWYDSGVWQTIQEDFVEMKDLSANIVRIHLQYNKFMVDLNTPNEASLDRLLDLVLYAQEQGMYLDITGLAAYRENDQPAFYNELSDEDRWATQAIFWESVADKVGSNPAVFAFNLMNEPVVSVECDGSQECDWFPGNSFGGFNFVQNITRTPNRPYAETMVSWIELMTASIRSKDNQTPITFGSLALGSFNQFAPNLDYLSPHIYPSSGEIVEAIDQVLNNQSDVPMVIEESSNLLCNITEFQQFTDGISGQYQGLMGHYFGRGLGELNPLVLVDAIHINFQEFFIANNPN